MQAVPSGQPVGSVQVVGGKLTHWALTPMTGGTGSPGVVEVRILLRGTDSDGTITKTVVMSVMSPPS